jgi:hypothetical protein
MNCEHLLLCVLSASNNADTFKFYVQVSTCYDSKPLREVDTEAAEPGSTALGMPFETFNNVALPEIMVL